MADTATTTAFVLVDVFLRRLVLPLVLLTAALIRYDVFSLVYLLLFMLGLLIPGPQLKAHKVSSIIYLVLLLVISCLFALTQVGFQISLATGLELTPCNGTGEFLEYTLRQIGLVQYNIPVVDILRYLLPDVVVLAVSVISLGFTIKVATLGSSSSAALEDPVTVQGSTEATSLSSSSPTPTLVKEQDYLRLPQLSLYIIDFLIFILLWLCGVSYTSVTSFAYFAFFLLLAILWSVQLTISSLIRSLRILTMLYTAVHFVVLYLYQFQAGQLLLPYQDLNTTKSLIARLLGLSPIIETMCSRPTQLLLSSIATPLFGVNAFALIALLWLLCTDLRLWMTTPRMLWSTYHTYCVPVLITLSSSHTHRVARSGSLPTVYGACDTTENREQEEETDAGNEDAATPTPKAKEGRQKRSLLRLKNRVEHYTVELWKLLMSVNYVFSILGMMVWSVLFISWPSLVLLLWACGIWLIPRLPPKTVLYYTSPVLVLYTGALLLIQFVYSLHLTTEELSGPSSLAQTCFIQDLISRGACRSFVVGGKSLLFLVFCASLRQWVREVKEMRCCQRREDHPALALSSGDQPLLALTDEGVQQGEESRSETTVAVYKDLWEVLSVNWALVVVGAFLLVVLVGSPALLKCVYLITFVFFLFIYQISRHWWYYINYPLWLLLVVYAVLHLVVVYTYQFHDIRNLWMMAYNSTHTNFTADDVFDSIGLIHYSNDFVQLFFTVLIPPTIFIAVMALQLRYFTPSLRERSRTEIDGSGSLVSTSYSKIATRLLQLFGSPDAQHDLEEAEQRQLEEEEEESGRRRPTRRSTAVHIESSPAGSEDSTLSQQRSLTAYRLVAYLLIKLRVMLAGLWHLFWRFAWLHTHKAAILVLFAITLYEVSAAYFVLLVVLVGITPLSILNVIMYPIITLFLGALALSKAIYQLPLIDVPLFSTDSCEDNVTTSPCDESLDIGFNQPRTFLTQYTNIGWFGLNKTDNPALYVAAPLLASLVLCFWFTAKRQQQVTSHRVQSYEKGSLFLGVTLHHAHTTILGSIKFLINHFFELYGVEVCWVMLAVTTAIRDDIYAVVFALLLGLLLVFPRCALRPLWLPVMLIQGVLLLWQYLLILGLPPFLCQGYPWSNISTPEDCNFNLSRQNRWLFFPIEIRVILNKNYLYADLFAYILMCLQMKNFVRNPIHSLWQSSNGGHASMFELNHVVDYFKVIIFEYSLWPVLFMVFVMAATQLSVFGLIYLITVFTFLYQGKGLLIKGRRKRLRWWGCLRALIWFVLLTRSALQILGCVYIDRLPPKYSCPIVLLLNSHCTDSSYFGIEESECRDVQDVLTGLWLDCFSFFLITLQMIMTDTDYGDEVQQQLLKKEAAAENFSMIMRENLAKKQKIIQQERDKELQQLTQRSEELKSSVKKIYHIVHAGAKIPPGYIVSTRGHILSLPAVTPSPPSSPHNTPTPEPAELEPDPTDSPQSETKEEVGKLRKALGFLWKVWLDTVDQVIMWLESTSADYRDVVTKIANEEKRISFIRSEETERDVTAPTEAAAATPGAIVTTAEVHLDKDEDGEQPVKTPPSPNSPPSSPTPVSILLHHVHPTIEEEEEAYEVQSQLKAATEHYTMRPKRLLQALYYWALSHFDYVVFFFVILAIMRGGSVASLGYAAILFIWGLLSIPWPTKRFWITLMFYTMLVLVVMYIYLSIVISLTSIESDTPLPGDATKTAFLWILGIPEGATYIEVAIFSLLLLMAIIFHRGLLRQYGLWKNTVQLMKAKKTSIIQKIARTVYSFFKELSSPTIVSGPRDYYIPILSCDVICFLTMVFGYSSFAIQSGGEGVIQVAEFITTNNIPPLFLAMLLLQFVSMLIDRAIYLRHSLLAKLIFYFVLLVTWHAWLFIVVPLITKVNFTDNAAAQVIYFFKCGYFIFSALQMVSGYPTRILGYFVNHNYSIVVGGMFMIYRVIPLLTELREMVDWMFTDTALSLVNWLRVQEIWAQMYINKVSRQFEKSFPRELGEAQSKVAKLFVGGAVVIGLVLLIWGPLLLISIVNQASVPNPPTGASVQLTLDGFQLLEISVRDSFHIMPITDIQYDNINSQVVDQETISENFRLLFDPANIRVIRLPGNSSVLWNISPPSRQQLLATINETLTMSNHSMELLFTWSFMRSPPTGLVPEEVQGMNKQLLNSTTNSTRAILEQLQCSLDGTCNGGIKLQDLYPFFIFSPATGASKDFVQLSRFLPSNLTKANCTARLNNDTDNMRWWTLTPTNPIQTNLSFFDSTEDLVMVVFSEQVAPPIFSFVSGLGVIGLYVSVVLVIGRFVRGYISSLPQNLLVDAILNPDYLLTLYDDIILVREAKQLRIEEILVGKLFYIFRSPEKLVELTEDLKEKKD